MAGLFEGIGSIVGGLFGNGNGAAEDEKQLELLRQAGAQYDNIDPAAVREINAEQMGPSAMGGVYANPAMRDAQMRALSSMQDMYSKGGMDAESQNQLNQVNQDVAQQDRARRDAIVQRAARQGRGTGGAAYAAMLSGAQGAAQTQSSADLQAHAAARQRALQAMQQSGQMAGQMREQEFGEGSARAQSADKINQFNTNLRQQAQMQNQQRDQQVFGNRMGLAGARAGGLQNQAQWHGDAGQRARDEGLGYGQAAGSAIDEGIKTAGKAFGGF